jgi:hypothetical protein
MTEHQLLDRALRRSFTVAQCQARHRGQPWSITWAEWRALWMANDLYLQRGRTRDSLCFSRLDLEDSWHINNVTIESKHDYLLRICDQRTMIRRALRKQNEFTV